MTQEELLEDALIIYHLPSPERVITVDIGAMTPKAARECIAKIRQDIQVRSAFFKLKECNRKINQLISGK